MRSCSLCPRKCRVNRLDGEEGICRTGRRAQVSSYGPHFGEESSLVGQHGSGTIFFTRCNLLCVFCQNYDISHEGDGQSVSDEEMARMMVYLQDSGCHNINLVTPSHVVPQILSALAIAAEKGLKIPLIYNTGAYDSVETPKLLDGVVDIYMPDFKFWGAKTAELVCGCADYPEVARESIRQMHQQVGDLFVNDSGIAERGLLVRHLVMPGEMGGTRQVMRFLTEKISKSTYVNIMNQYRPCGRAGQFEKLNRRPSRTEYEQAVTAAMEEGITRLDRQRRVFCNRIIETLEDPLIPRNLI